MAKHRLHSVKLKNFIRSRLKELIGSHPLWNSPRQYLAGQNAKSKIRSEDCEKFPGLRFHKQDTVVAGGAIAALVNEFLHGVPAVINDVDLFSYEFSGSSKQSVGQELYDNFHEENYNYEMTSVTEIGIVNLIKILPNEEFYWENLLESFDLNCCQVLYNIAEHRLYFTEDFINFTDTRKITWGTTWEDEYPLTSFIRAQRKTQELQAQWFLSDAVQEYLHIFIFKDYFLEGKRRLPIKTNREEKNSSGEAEFISPKRLKQWEQEPNLLAPYLFLQQDHVVIGDLCDRYHWQDFYRQLRTLKLEPQELEAFENFRNYPDNDRTHKYLWQYTKSELNRLLLLCTNSLIKPTQLVELIKFYPHLLKTDLNQNQIAGAKKFFQAHPELSNLVPFLIITLNYSLPEILQTITQLRRWPLAHLGFLEAISPLLFNATFINLLHLRCKQEFPLREEFFTQTMRKLFKKNQLTPRDFNNLNQYFPLMEFFNQRNLPAVQNYLVTKLLKQEVLTTPLNLGPWKKVFQELTTKTQLEREGEKMRHCVGGYVNAVQEERSRIFHIQTGTESSTLELRSEVVLNKNQSDKKPPNKYAQTELDLRLRRQKNFTQWSLAQHCAFANQVPSRKHKNLAQQFLRYLNFHQIKSSKS